MDDNGLSNASISTTRKFIFSDAFYDKLAGIDNDSTETMLSEDNISVPEETNNNIDDINNFDITENVSLDTNNIKEENIVNDNTVNQPIVDSVSDIENDTVTLNGDNNMYPSLNEEVNDNVIPIENQSDMVKDEKTKDDFTTFLLGNNANYKTIKPPVEEPSVVPINDNSTSQIPLDNSLNVETGIDTNLENFLFNQKVESPIEEDEFAEYRKSLEPIERKVYRAARRKRKQPTSKLLTNDVSNEINYNKIDDNIDEPLITNYNQLPNLITKEEEWKPKDNLQPIVITEEIDYSESLDDENTEVIISNLLDELAEKSKSTGKISILAKYGDDFCSHNYVTNPAIGREREIKELGLILLTPEKSAILVGKPGIGKTSIVEGLAYRIQRNKVPNALKGYRIISVKTTSLLGTLPSGETRLQTLIDEIKDLDKIILFIDEVHMLMGATNESSLDFANMFKESLGRGTIKMIGATTSDEYERYVLRDKAFVRRFQRVDVAEPTKEQTVEILMGTLPKIEKATNAKLKYTHYLQVEIMTFIVDITSEYKRVYGIGSRYPDICITLVSQAFSEAVFDNRNEVNILDIRNAIENSKNIYSDVIRKELMIFDDKFKDLIKQEKDN